MPWLGVANMRNTALMVAADHQREDMLETLLQKKPVNSFNINARNKAGKTALFVATEKSHERVVEWLFIYAKADPGIKDNEGKLALDIARGVLEKCDQLGFDSVFPSYVTKGMCSYYDPMTKSVRCRKDSITMWWKYMETVRVLEGRPKPPTHEREI